MLLALESTPRLDIERTDVPFICKTLGCHPVASADHFTPESLANVDLVEEVAIGGESNCTKVVYFRAYPIFNRF